MAQDRETAYLRVLSKCMRVMFAPGVQATMETTPLKPIEVSAPVNQARLEYCDEQGRRYVAQLPAKGAANK